MNRLLAPVARIWRVLTRRWWISTTKHEAILRRGREQFDDAYGEAMAELDRRREQVLLLQTTVGEREAETARLHVENAELAAQRDTALDEQARLTRRVQELEATRLLSLGEPAPAPEVDNLDDSWAADLFRKFLGVEDGPLELPAGALLQESRPESKALPAGAQPRDGSGRFVKAAAT